MFTFDYFVIFIVLILYLKGKVLDMKRCIRKIENTKHFSNDQRRLHGPYRNEQNLATVCYSLLRAMENLFK